MPFLARAVARPDGIVDAGAIGARATKVPFAEPELVGASHDPDRNNSSTCGIE